MDFEKLTYKIKDKLYRFSLRIVGSSTEAEDIVQEVFIKVWDRRGDMENVQNPEAYCMTLTKNLSLDKLKSKHRQTAEIGEAMQISSSESTPYAVVETNDMMQRIRNIMQELPEKQRMVMHLRDIEDMTYEDIAETLDLPMPQVKVYLHRARTYVRSQLINMSI
jgi:RNA polymerase sigma-70 factor (ECF subfamily)